MKFSALAKKYYYRNNSCICMWYSCIYSVHMYAGAHVCSCMFVLGLKVDAECLPSSFFPSFMGLGSLSEPEFVQFRLVQLSSLLQFCPLPASLVLGLQIATMPSRPGLDTCSENLDSSAHTGIASILSMEPFHKTFIFNTLFNI